MSAVNNQTAAVTFKVVKSSLQSVKPKHEYYNLVYDHSNNQAHFKTAHLNCAESMTKCSFFLCVFTPFEQFVKDEATRAS